MGTEGIWNTKGARRLLVPCSSPLNLWQWFTNFIPIIQWLPNYNWKTDLTHDIIGGLTIGVMHVPQGIAYAVLAGVDPIYGSFSVTAIMCLLASDEVMLQRTGRMDDMIVADNDTTISSITSVEITTVLAFTTGIVELIAGVLQLEFITAYFSDQLVSGFITGSCVHVVVAQIDDLFGINASKFHGMGYLFKRFYSILMHIPQTNFYVLGMSIFGMIFLYLGKSFVTPFLHKHLPFKIPVPYELFLIIISIVISHFMNLNTYHNVPIVGQIPTGLPRPRLPRFDVVVDCFPYAIGIAAVTFAVHISMAKMIAKRMKYHIDSKQELYALGFTSVLSSFFPIFPISTALARTAVSIEVGTRSQFAAVSTCLLLLAVILTLGPLLNALPMCILAVIIVMSLRSMFQKFSELPKIWPVSKIDFLIWIVAFMTTVTLDVMLGLIISVIFALMTLIFRSQWPRWERLVQLSVCQSYFDNPKRYIAAANNHNIRLYRFESPLLFNNVERFKLSIYNAITDWEHKTDSINDLKNADNLKSLNQRYLILDCSGISYTDFMGLNILKEVVSELKSQGITVYFSACNKMLPENGS
ncbi:unnamed protein product [Acanthocheilonema viteae]|uniref:STAS domain-containing protein n=1 Tax=Acanthocheilonema viteae TaxID=6277 RepID=A0A498SE38_ACAVI|nr:unnamed protein product [Acanthocheilonema viteae]